MIFSICTELLREAREKAQGKDKVMYQAAYADAWKQAKEEYEASINELERKFEIKTRELRSCVEVECELNMSDAYNVLLRPTVRRHRGHFELHSIGQPSRVEV
jgi:hypothetical protein